MSPFGHFARMGKTVDSSWPNREPVTKFSSPLTATLMSFGWSWRTRELSNKKKHPTASLQYSWDFDDVIQVKQVRSDHRIKLMLHLRRQPLEAQYQYPVKRGKNGRFTEIKPGSIMDFFNGNTEPGEAPDPFIGRRVKKQFGFMNAPAGFYLRDWNRVTEKK